MKYVISFLFCTSLQAATINLFHEGNSIEANMLRDILISDYKIPDELIGVKQTELCEDLQKKGKLNLCLKNNGDLIVVSVDRRFVNESLKAFQAH